MLSYTSYVSDSGREYIVVPHLYFTKGGYERCTYEVFLETCKVAECELTSQIPFTINRFENSN
jgi:hypothetical protein